MPITTRHAVYEVSRGKELWYHWVIGVRDSHLFAHLHGKENPKLLLVLGHPAHKPQVYHQRQCYEYTENH